MFGIPRRFWWLACLVHMASADFLLRRDGGEQFVERAGVLMTVKEVMQAWQADPSFQDPDCFKRAMELTNAGTLLYINPSRSGHVPLLCIGMRNLDKQCWLRPTCVKPILLSQREDFFLSVLKDQPYDAFFWEMPPIRTEWLDAKFKFVTVDGSQSFEGRGARPP